MIQWWNYLSFYNYSISIKFNCGVLASWDENFSRVNVSTIFLLLHNRIPIFNCLLINCRTFQLLLSLLSVFPSLLSKYGNFSSNLMYLSEKKRAFIPDNFRGMIPRRDIIFLQRGGSVGSLWPSSNHRDVPSLEWISKSHLTRLSLGARWRFEWAVS